MTNPIKLTDEVLADILQKLYAGSECYAGAEMQLEALRTLRDRARAVADSGRPIPWDIHGPHDIVSREKLDALREVLPEVKP